MRTDEKRDSARYRTAAPYDRVEDSLVSVIADDVFDAMQSRHQWPTVKDDHLSSGSGEYRRQSAAD